MPWPSTFTLEGRNRIDQHQSFLRVIPVGTGQPDGERHASRVANQMTLAPSLGAIRGMWTGLRTAVHRPDRAAVNNRSGPIDVAFAGEPIQEREVHQIPDSFRLPVAQPPPACHARTAAQFLRQQPWYSAAQHEKDFRPHDESRCEPVNVGVRRRFRPDLTQFLHSPQLPCSCPNDVRRSAMEHCSSPIELIHPGQTPRS